jgi:hypothetical protein
MASSAREQLWTAPRVAKEREILFEAIADGSVVSWQHITCRGIRFLGRKARGYGPNQVPKIGGLKAVRFWEQRKDVFRCVYPVCGNRVASYVPLLEEPQDRSVLNRKRIEALRNPKKRSSPSTRLENEDERVERIF